jgi:simple sugar transport system permease protein
VTGSSSASRGASRGRAWPTRLGPSTKRELEAAAIALLASVAIGSVMMLVAGAAPHRVWATMIAKIATDPYWTGEALYRATSLALAGLSVALALDAGLFNIGGEGQIAAGVLACSVAGAALPDGTPALFAIPACALAAAAGGAAVGWLIGFLRVRRGAHEVITSIMLNTCGSATRGSSSASPRAVRRSRPAPSCRRCRSRAARRMPRSRSPRSRSR